MTTAHLIELAGNHSVALAATLVGIPLLAWIAGMLQPAGQGGASPWKYFYSLLVYLACVPGIFAVVLVGYALFFTRQNLLEVNSVVYFLPIVSMIAALVLIRKRVPFEAVPGFDRLSGLMVLIAITFGLVLAIERSRIWIVFGGSFAKLAFLALAVFAMLKWASHTLLRPRGEPAPRFPKFRNRGN